MSAILLDDGLRERMGQEGKNIVTQQSRVMDCVAGAIKEVVWKSSQT